MGVFHKASFTKLKISTQKIRAFSKKLKYFLINYIGHKKRQDKTTTNKMNQQQQNTDCSVCGCNDGMDFIHKYTGLYVCTQHFIHQCQDCGCDLDDSWNEHESSTPMGDSVCLACGEQYNN